MKKPVRFVHKPISVETIPQTRVTVGNQNFGLVLLKTMFQGTSKRM